MIFINAQVPVNSSDTAMPAETVWFFTMLFALVDIMEQKCSSHWLQAAGSAYGNVRSSGLILVSSWLQLVPLDD